MKSDSSRQGSFFWPAFVVSFGLLALGSCAGLVALSGFDELNLAELQPGESAWTPPPQAAVPAVPPVADAEQPDPTAGTVLGFGPGAVAANATGSRVNIRQAPGYLSKPPDDIIAQMQPGEQVTILDGPQRADNLVWWRVRFQGAAAPTPVEGWVAESTASGVQILAQVE